MLRQAIALSDSEGKERENEDVEQAIAEKNKDEEEALRRAIALSEENEKEDDEEELLRQAIALSLEAWK